MIRLILPLLFIVVAIGGFFKLTDPAFKDIDALKTERDHLNQALSNAKELRAVQDSLLQAKSEISQDDLDRLNKFLPDSIDNVRLIIDTNNIARRSGMSIKGLKIKTAAGKQEDTALNEAGAGAGGTQATTLGFSVTGPYTNFQSFLSDLAKSLRLVDVQATGFSSGQSVDKDGRVSDLYTYNVEIQTYWLK